MRTNEIDSSIRRPEPRERKPAAEVKRPEPAPSEAVKVNISPRTEIKTEVVREKKETKPLEVARDSDKEVVAVQKESDSEEDKAGLDTRA